jgi:Flp pilus assembly protein TadD
MTGKFSDALDSYAAAMSLAPNSAQLHSELANIYEQMGNEERALQLRSKAVEFQRSGVDPALSISKRPITRNSC